METDSALPPVVRNVEMPDDDDDEQEEEGALPAPALLTLLPTARARDVQRFQLPREGVAAELKLSCSILITLSGQTFSRFQLPREGVAAELELSCSILSTRMRATCWESARAGGGDGCKAQIAGIDTMQSRCTISGMIASQPLPSLDPPRHTCRWPSPSAAPTRFTFASRPPAVGQSYAA